MRFSPVVALFTAFLLFAGLAFAKGPVTGEIKVFVVSTDDSGKEIVTEANETEPGQTMEFRIIQQR